MAHESGESDPRFQTGQARERAWMNAIPDLLFVLDRDGVYLDYHAADLHQLLVPPDQFLGKKIDEVMPSQIAERLMASLARVLLSSLRVGRMPP